MRSRRRVVCYVFCKLHSTSINCCSSPLYSYFTEQLNLFIGAIFVGYRLEIWKILHTPYVDDTPTHSFYTFNFLPSFSIHCFHPAGHGHAKNRHHSPVRAARVLLARGLPERECRRIFASKLLFYIPGYIDSNNRLCTYYLLVN